MKYKPGDIIKVKVGGIEYETYIDERGTQRFRKNSLLDFLFNSRENKKQNSKVDLNELAILFHSKNPPFSQRDYAEFNMMLGYSVAGFAELSSFEDMEIENPVWEKDNGE